MPKKEKGCRSLTGNPPGKTLFNIVVRHCSETSPRHKRHAGGAKVAFVANKNGTTMATNSREYDVKKFTKRAGNVSGHGISRQEETTIAVAKKTELMIESIAIALLPRITYQCGYKQQQGAFGLVKISYQTTDNMISIARGNH